MKAPELPRIEGFSLLHGGNFCTLTKYDPSGHEILHVNDSVATVIYIEDTEEIILTWQQRDAMRTENTEGYIHELVAGHIDKDGEDILDTAVREIWEESGIVVSKDEVHFLFNGKPLALSPGVLTERIYGTYVIIDSSRLSREIHFGLAEENENISLVRVPISNMFEINRDPAFIDSTQLPSFVTAFMIEQGLLVPKGKVENERS